MSLEKSEIMVVRRNTKPEKEIIVEDVNLKKVGV